MKNRLSLLISLCALMLVSACGGGGGGGGSVATTPVASTQTFQTDTAMDTDFNSSSTRTFSISGTVNGIAVSGNGTVTFGGIVNTTFEGVTALQKNSTVSVSVTANGVTIPLTTTSSSYVDSNYVPLGSVGSGSYEVVTDAVNIPATALVNDTGTAYMANIYSSSAKATLNGTDTVTYVLLPDTASTALLQITHTYRDTGGSMTSQDVSTSRLTPQGTSTPISESGYVVSTNTRLVFTY